MKKIFLLLVLTISVVCVNAQYKKDGTPDMRYKANKTTYGNSYSTPSRNTYVSGYTKKNGTYVQPYVRTNANSTNRDNYSTKSNYNPYNGTTGTKAKDYSSDALKYGAGKTIYTGPRGGQYYYNSNGNKVYVPKR
ncbi:MAG: hypothetical protein LBG80_13790 [Bacteroidales bacterium]|nr:hypothetical protein [Bacteroidales bacterium]